MIENRHVVLHLSLIEGVGPGTINRLIEQATSKQFAQLYEYSAVQLQHEYGLSENGAQRVAAGLAEKRLLERELALIEKYRIGWLTVDDAEYPALLKKIYSPPAILYWMGEHICFSQLFLGLVGSRQADTYGQTIVNILVPDLVARGFVTVSGGAIGADSMVHEQTMAAGGKTIAVLGSGLLHWYPRVHYSLFERIIASGGVLMSSFALDTRAHPTHFPARNRIISGLSVGSVIIQAAAESGTRITAQYCLEQGRELFAVPGPITHPLSAGCHQLIAQGAKLISSADDIVQELGHYEPFVRSCVLCKKTSVSGLVTVQMQEGTSETGTDVHAIILALCQQPQTTDAIIEASGCVAPEAAKLLFDLQLAGKIVQTGLGMWQTTR